MSSESSRSELPSSAAGATNSPSAHGRHKSVPRRSTINALDVDDPLAPSSPPRQSLVPERKPVLPSRTPESRSPAPAVTVVERAKKDFSFLVRRDHFHALSDNNIPLAFRESPFYPTSQSSIQELLSNGHFRAAAGLAAQQLTTQVTPTDHEAIFSLLFTRLACLQLAGLHDIAAQESKAFQDLNGSFYFDSVTGKHMAPWELRVLVVRLQAIGFGDWRRGVMGYYELAREARIEARNAEPDAAKAWAERLHDVGIRVGNALLEIGDNEGAIRHLKTLRASDILKLKTRLGLVYLRAGDIVSARGCIDSDNVGDNQTSMSARALEALCKMADGSFKAAVTDWQELASSPEVEPDIAQIARQNLAVCLVFIGEIQQVCRGIRPICSVSLLTEIQARDVLEKEVNDNSINHATTFNLAAIYELCSEKSGDHKVELSSRIAARQPASTGWDLTNADFKL